MRTVGFGRIASFFAFFTVVSIFVTLFLAVTGERMASKNALLVDAAMEVKLHGALAHLWFEEVISGDVNEDVNTVWNHIREADWYLMAMLEGGHNDEGAYKKIEDPDLRLQTFEVRHSLQEFESIARDRFSNHNQSKTGSEIDQRFDQVFKDFLAKADRVETQLLLRLSADLERFRFLSVALVSFMMLFGLVIGVAILRLERQKEAHLAKIASVSAEIKEKNAELEGVILNLPGVAYTYLMPPGHDTPGPEDKITFVNKNACQAIWGLPAELVEADSMLIAELVDDPAALEDISEAIRNSSRHLAPWYAVWPIRTLEGEKKWLEGRGHPVRQADGSTIWYSLVVEATEQVEREEELKREREVSLHGQKQQSIGQLTGGVAHDFNNLLAVILGNLELLSDDINDAKLVKLIEASINATKRGADLTSKMLSFARKATLDPEMIDLNRQINETRTWAGRTFPATVQIETSLLAGLWKVSADYSSTESALLNLLLNARDAMPEGGKLTIETANVRIDKEYIDNRQENLEPGRYVMLAVSDTGEGIAPDDLTRIFEPFYTTKAPGAGSGLGLSMIDGFMRQSGGLVRVYSELGVGTTFKLYFKAALEQDFPIEAVPSLVEPAETGQKILVAEDEAEVLSVIVATLEKAGYNVTPATNGDMARALFEENPDFDLLLTDIVMPGTLQGTTLSRVLRGIAQELPVVFMSGYAAEATVHGNGLRPEDIRLMKPVARDDLLLAIARGLSNKTT